MENPALTHDLERLWQQIEALQRAVAAAVGGPQAALRDALAQLATALRTLRTTQEAQYQAHEVAEVQGAAQRRDLTDANTRLRAEITTHQQALIRAGRVLTEVFAARQRAEAVQASLTHQLQVNADRLAITEGQLEARTAELRLAHQAIEAMHAELLAMNTDLLAFNTELLAQVTRETEAGITEGQLQSPPVELWGWNGRPHPRWAPWHPSRPSSDRPGSGGSHEIRGRYREG